jgi:hypothetical protein
MTLVLPDGEVLTSLQYEISNGIKTYTGTVDVDQAPSPSFVIGGVVAGDGYTLALSGTTTDGRSSCSGTSAAFSVRNRQTTLVICQLTCSIGSDAGSTTVNPITNDCPVWNTIVANPSLVGTAPPANVTLLTASATAPNDSQLIYAWSVISGTGTLSNQSPQGTTTNTINFTCPPQTIEEVDVVQLVVSDQPGAMCPTSDTTGTVRVECALMSPCYGIGAGVLAVPDTATGSCPAGQINTGTLTDSNGNFCCSPIPTVSYSVVRHGAVGAAQLTDETATPVFVENHSLNWMTLADTLVSTVAMPTAASGAQQPFAYQGVAGAGGANDGAMSLSTDGGGHYLALVGYGATPGTTNIVTTTRVPRVVARVSANGTVDTSTFFTAGSAYMSAFIRSAATFDGSAFWVGGGDDPTGGIWSIPFGAAGGGTQLNSSPTRVVNLFSDLVAYGDSAPLASVAEVFSVGTVGTGLPLSPPATDVVVPGLPDAVSTTGATVSPWAFAFVGDSTLYVASDQAIGSNNPPSGIQKWTLSGGGTWSLQTTFNLAAGQAVATPVGFRGLAVLVVDAVTLLIASTVEPGTTSVPANHLALFVDRSVTGDGSGMTEVGQLFLQAPSSTLYKGVALTPR